MEEPIQNMNKLDTVSVILSAYNGEKYLKEQLDSILNQENISVKLICRDDGSSDDTLTILKTYKENNRDIVDITAGDNIGCVRSFYEALSRAVSLNPECNYFAFADQDDYWLTDKLASGVKMMSGINNDIPILYYCKPKLVDEDLIPVKDTWNSDNYSTLGEACMIQPAAGCTMMFNRKTAELFLRATPEDMLLHDSWLYKTVVAMDGAIIEDSCPHILYRQHENNLVGGEKTFLSDIRRRYQTFFHNRHERLKSIRSLLNVYASDMPEKNLKFLKTLSNYNKSFKCKVKILLSREFRTNRRMSNICFKISVLFNRY